MELDNLTEDNWRQLAPKLAASNFPVGSLVAFNYALQDNFGRVERHTPSGMVVVVPGVLDEVSRKLSGAYWEIDYDPNTFRPQSYGATRGKARESIMFRPSYDVIAGEPEIHWYLSDAGILGPLKLNEDGMVHESKLDY